MNEILHYTLHNLFWSIVGFAFGVTTTVLYLTSPRGRDSRLGRWLVGHREKVSEMDDRPNTKGEADFPYHPWRRYLGPIILALAILSVASMAYDANQRNKQTRCLASFVEATTINIAGVRELAAQDRQVLDKLIRRIAAGQPQGAYRPLIARLRAGESAESVLIDLLTIVSRDHRGSRALNEFLAERKRIDAVRAEHPMPQMTNCLDHGERLPPSPMPPGSGSG